ncbi:MAG TPA: c-type cytochrome [Acidimicrobiales bacterium]|nr:c-type cytochrome [Acidimicrobiales bacterium]
MTTLPPKRLRSLLPHALLVLVVAAMTVLLFGRGAGAATGGSSPPTTNAYGSSGVGFNSPPNPSGAAQFAAQQAAEAGNASAVAKGHQMFLQSCASCHGVQGQGTVRAPTIAGLGPAAVDFWVSTGRMPLEIPTAQAIRKQPLYDEKQAGEIAAYVGSVAPGGDGIPSVNTRGADLQRGGELFRDNCATCHSYLAVGGVLSYGAFAPSLAPDTPRQIAEAIRTGPGNMPRFAASTLSDKDVADIIRYVGYITKPQDHGGLALGHIGPVTEGLIGIGMGVGLMMLAAFWIGDRA